MKKHKFKPGDRIKYKMNDRPYYNLTFEVIKVSKKTVFAIYNKDFPGHTANLNSSLNYGHHCNWLIDETQFELDLNYILDRKLELLDEL